MSRLFTVAIALMCLVGAVSAHELRNSGGQFTFVPERGFHRAVAAGFSSAGLPGHPELPVRHLTCILPPGVKADSVQFKACDYAFRALTVKYGVPVQGRVRLQLYDVQGRIAAAITDEELKPGYYRQDISRQALSLPAGVYFLALTQHGNRVTRKVTLVE